VKEAREADLRLVRFLWCGNDGTVRAKASAVGGLEGRIESGIGLTVAMQAMNGLDHLQPVEGMGPVGEVRLVPDPETFRVLPYAPRTGAMLVDLIQLSGEPAPQCPRSFLKRTAERLEERAGVLEASFENEFSLARVVDGAFVPVDSSLCFSTIGLTASQDYVDALVGALERQEIGLEQYYAELGHGQQELSTAHAPALRAADEQILVRETVRGVASGLEHLPGLCGLTAPSFNSYHRIIPQYWAGAFTCWGHDNREAPVRVPSLFRGSEEASTNVELKAADASCNPYLAIGGLIAAGLDGLERELEPPEPVEVDPATIAEDERAARGILRLPATQEEALDALAADQVLTTALGPTLTTSYLAVRRSEWAAYSAGDEAFEQQGHFSKY
jgi:glutamine synthetase